MDDRTWFEIGNGDLTSSQTAFLLALRRRLDDRVRPYCVELTADQLVLVVDVDGPEVALVNVGLELRGHRLRGDRISVHDRTFPPTPTRDGFSGEGPADELAARGAELIESFVNRPIVRHEWVHRGKVYANCYVFEDSGERLAQMYRGEWAPRGQEAQLRARGFERGRGWVQTEGLGEPDRVELVRGQR